MRWTAIALCLTSLLLAGAERVRADDAVAAPELRYDPFSRSSLGARGRDHDDADSGASWRPELRATLVAGSRSVANLGGVLLRPGEEFDGYQLVEVREFEADFLRGEQKLTIPLDGEETP